MKDKVSLLLYTYDKQFTEVLTPTQSLISETVLTILLVVLTGSDDSIFVVGQCNVQNTLFVSGDTHGHFVQGECWSIVIIGHHVLNWEEHVYGFS